jgi:hypothetical protein
MATTAVITIRVRDKRGGKLEVTSCMIQVERSDAISDILSSESKAIKIRYVSGVEWMEQEGYILGSQNMEFVTSLHRVF